MLGVTPEGTEEHEQHWQQERVSRNPAASLDLGKKELELCMSLSISRTGPDTLPNTSQGVTR